MAECAFVIMVFDSVKLLWISTLIYLYLCKYNKTVKVQKSVTVKIFSQNQVSKGYFKMIPKQETIIFTMLVSSHTTKLQNQIWWDCYCSIFWLFYHILSLKVFKMGVHWYGELLKCECQLETLHINYFKWFNTRFTYIQKSTF